MEQLFGHFSGFNQYVRVPTPKVKISIHSFGHANHFDMLHVEIEPEIGNLQKY